jgi:Rv2525c-like, glycoside hydrolase-like domain
MTGQDDPGGYRTWRRALAVVGGVAVAVAFGTAAIPSAPSALAAPRAAAAGSARTVTYHGYTVSVPASWPVYNLADDPGQCVLFNKHAVYLGTPGANQNCPARAYGRTDALLIQPSGTAATTATSAQPAVVLPRDAAALPDTTGALPAAARTAAGVTHVIRVDASGPGVVVTASYGTDPTAIRAILAGATMTGPAAAATTPAAAAATTTPAATTPAAADPGASALTETTGTGLGFDTCTAPSVATMADWLASPYRVAATYLGGSNWACSYGNFSASWVQRVAAEGWGFLPLWVGPQAPCTTLSGVTTIDPAQAAAQGQQEAASAVTAAQSFGYGSGTPLYFDMEGYDNADTSCSQAVLSFLGGWTQGLHAAGYLSGVYSSASSGISDLVHQYGTSYPSPDAIWVAHWNTHPVLTDAYVPAADWASDQRVRQYGGPHEETWGGDTIDIDSDISDAPVAGSAAGASPSAIAALASPDETTVAPGGPCATIGVTVNSSASTATAVHWRADAPAGLSVRPAQGTASVEAGGSLSISLRVSASGSLADGRYDIPITVTSGGNSVAETFELVSVTPAGTTLSTSYPVVLYAADQDSMAVAAAAARELALPAGDVTGDFSQAWSDAASGDDLVLAVGQAAENGLYSNPCGWTNPVGDAAGSTPFYIPVEQVQSLPGADAFEAPSGSDTDATALLTSQLTQYALAGTLPNYGNPPTNPQAPTSACLGSADVAVP